ncbi:MAG: glycoside hydrolase family 43 protein [Planctomycetales bacterium]|nr:glycoside hydrolase family 43 protein [Planctomycetales bacterium]
MLHVQTTPRRVPPQSLLTRGEPRAASLIRTACRLLVVGWNLVVTPSLAADEAVDEQTNVSEAESLASELQFINPLYAGQDPYLTRFAGDYVQAVSERIGRRGALVVYRSPSLLDQGTARVVYTAPATGRFSRELWAPEIHRLGGKWFIYACADDGDNANHRLIVLQGSSDDPQGEFHFAKELATPGWAIDATVFEHPDGRLFCLWSGWPDGFAPDSTQHLFISAMRSPTELSGQAVDISGTMYEWEKVERPAGLNEGPQALLRDGKLLVVYSASGSWTADYCLGLLECDLNRLLDARAWHKLPRPLFSRSADVYGPGHCCFVKSPDDSQDWIVYHSSVDREGSWRRCVSAKPFTWDAAGRPNFGSPLSWGVATPAPSGEPRPNIDAAVALHFENQDRDQLQEFIPPGHRGARLANNAYHFRAPVASNGLEVKSLVRGVSYDDAQVVASLKLQRGDCAGILFRVGVCAVGENRWSGYLARLCELDGSHRTLELVACDGRSLTTLATTHVDASPTREMELRVDFQDDRLRVFVDAGETPALEASDRRFIGGRVGMLSLDSDVDFHRLRIGPPQTPPGE